MSDHQTSILLAFATLLYGGAALLLWWENRRDRIHRQAHFEKEMADRKLVELHRAFYEAWGYWKGHANRPGETGVDASQTGRIFEALIRLECQLRLNGYRKEANDFGFAVRTMENVDERLSAVGLAIGLLPADYRNPALITANPALAETKRARPCVD